MEKHYEFSSFSPKGVSADVAGRELEKIRKSHGRLVAQTVVNASRPVDAPLHPVFEWDDAAAGEQWRIHQARNLIRSVQVVHEGGKCERAYYPVIRQSEAGTSERYYQAASVMTPAEYESTRRFFEAKIAALSQTYQDLLALAERDRPEDLPMLRSWTQPIAALRQAVFGDRAQ